MANLYAVIMAGGVGSRFWPRSRERSPKQFLPIVSESTMIQQTVRRLEPMIPPMNTFVVTNVHHADLVMSQLPFIPQENIIAEPFGRNTAPCIGLAALWIQRIDPEGIMLVLPADHLIADQDSFRSVLETAASVASRTKGLITIGIKPTHPETGYGYIQFDDGAESNPFRDSDVYRVKTFAEKPNLETAERFLESGDFLWNSGMFVWTVNSILAEIREHLPELNDHLEKVREALGTPDFPSVVEHAYGKIKGISIDYGVMERAGNVYVIKGDFGWSDVGSWDEVTRISKADENGNVLSGKVVARDVSNSFISVSSRLVAAVGVEDLIIIESGDALLICRKGRSQEVKDVVDVLRRKQMNEFL